MKSCRLVSIVTAAALAAACGRGGGRSGKVLPTQVSLELAGAAAAVPQALSPRLAALGVRSLFLPAVRAAAAGNSAVFEKAPPPGSPYPLPVYLEVAGTGDFDGYFQARREKAADEIWAAVAPALGSPAYGRVLGLHLSLRVARAAPEYAEALVRLRHKLGGSRTLSAAIFTSLDEEQQKKWSGVARTVDFLVPAIFGRVADAGPEGFRVTADLGQLASFDTPLCPVLAPQGWGTVKLVGGGGPSLSDLRINDLSEDRRFEFSFGSLLSNADEDEYVFTAKQPVRNPAWGSPAAAEGDTVTFRERRVGDLAAALSGARTVNGKIIRLDSLDDQDHLIGFSVVEDLLLGRPLVPRLTFSCSGVPGAATFMAVNSSAEFSQLTRMGNWMDLRLADATIGEVRPGDFDRYEFLDAAGDRVPSGRARIIRFYQNFVAPGKSMTTGPIRYSGKARFFGSAHITLPDGRTADSPETEIENFPDQPPPAASPEPRPGRRKGSPGRKR